jgi:hypothetical protein
MKLGQVYKLYISMGLTFLIYNLLINIIYPFTYAFELQQIYASDESE